jgi:NedA-like, galactose-binding domain
MVNSNPRMLTPTHGDSPPAARFDPTQERSFRLAQAKLFAEVARRTESPFDALPVGDVLLVYAALWKEAVYWALAALADRPSLPRDIVAALADAPADVVRKCSRGVESVPQLLMALEIEPRSVVVAEDARQHKIATVSAFARALIAHIDAPAVERERRLFRRVIRRLGGLIAAVAILTIAFVWIWDRSHRPLAATLTTSSEYPSCQNSMNCGNSLFHTNEEDQPWAMFDLGSEVELHRIDVENRSDCCYDRAVPLVVETGNDGIHWKGEYRLEKPFSTQSIRLETKARYVRLRVDRRSILHLASVVIR